MRLFRLLAAAVLAVLALPAVAAGQEAPAAPVTASPAVSSRAVEAPPASAELLGAIFVDSGGLPCAQMCFVSRVCGCCDPPVTVSCSGCRSCNQGWLGGVVCDGVQYSCPPCAC